MALLFVSCQKEQFEQPGLQEIASTAGKEKNSKLSTDGITSLSISKAKVSGTNLNTIQKNAILGVCWSSTNPEPTVEESVKVTTPVEGAFSINITGLLPNVTYYARVFFASNEVTPGKYADLRYGNVISFKTEPNDPVFLTWSILGRNTTFGGLTNTEGIRWDGQTQGDEVAFTSQSLEEGEEVIAFVPDAINEAWTLGLSTTSSQVIGLDFFVEINGSYTTGGNGLPNTLHGTAANGDQLKIKYVNQTISIELSTDNGANWIKLYESSAGSILNPSYAVAFKSRGGGTNQIYFLKAE